MSKSGVIEWKQNVVVQQITDAVVASMETAANVVETDARHRLLSVAEPAFGRKYRMVLALYRLTSTVKHTATEVTAQIGIPRGEKGGDYGFWIEVGSRTAKAHPWLRPALVNNLRTIVSLLGGK